MSLDALVLWMRMRGPRVAGLLVVGLLVEWLCARLGTAVERRLRSSSPDNPAGGRLARFVGSSIRILGHVWLLDVGLIIALDIAGLSLDLAVVVDWLRSTGAQIAIVVILAVFAARVVNLAAQYAEGAVLRRRGSGDLSQRARTVGAVARNFGLAAIVAVAMLMILAALGVDTAPLLASAGIVGVAIGFGAQTLVKDLISGLFILVEDQFAVGDTIQVGATAGQVERMTVRSTLVRELNGTLHTVPNGEIRLVANMTRDWSRAVVDVGIGYQVPVERALGLMRSTLAGLAADPAFAGKVLEAPQVLGVTQLEAARVVLRAIITTKPGEHWVVSREANYRLKAAFEREGLDMGAAPLAVLVRNDKGEEKRSLWKSFF